MFLYVNATAIPGGTGKKEAPFQSINDAAKLAQPGDTVCVAPGIYREHVIPTWRTWR